MIFGMTHDPEHAVDATALAAMLDVTRETIYRWARSGRIPSVHPGRLYRFFPSEVVEALRPPPPGSWHQSPQSRARRRRQEP